MYNYNGNKYSYEYQEKSCGICTVVEGSGNSIGDKLECEVKPGTIYNFYILSRNEDETLNLIMDSNIYYNSNQDTGIVTELNPGYIEWYDKNDDSRYGPVTAMNYLYNATKDWSNIPNIVINYIDEGNNYGSIITTNYITKITKKDGTVTNGDGYTNLKARLPYWSEVSDNWSMYSDYLNLYSDVRQKNPIEGIYGYWSLSSDAVAYNLALCVHSKRGTYSVRVDGGDGIGAGGSMGVRPVINVNL